MRITVFAACLLTTIVLGTGSASATVEDCTAATEDEIAARFDAWNGALGTRHPDRVTRLYAADATVLTETSAAPRTGYAEIREHYLYFLQREPSARVVARAIRLGCNVATDVGTAILTLRGKRAGAAETAVVRYSFVHVFVDGIWAIAHHHVSLVPDGGPTEKLALRRANAADVPVARAAHHKAPAVAGYTKRLAGPTGSAPRRSAPAPASWWDDYKPATWKDGSPQF